MRVTTSDLIDKNDIKTSDEIIQIIMQSKFTFYVYFLIDPFSLQIKYIGKGLSDRCLDHYKERELKDNRKNTWLKKLAKRGKRPLYAIWEFYGDELSEDEVYDEESNLIYMMGRKGLDKQGTLLNLQTDTKYRGGRALGLDLFISKAKAIHGDKYGYNNSIYKGMNNLISIDCPIHKEFEQKASSHIYGKAGCPKCAGNQELTFKQFKEVCDKDKVSQTEFISDYEGMSYYMEFRCKKHNKVYTQTAENFKLGNGCQECIDESKRVQFSLGMTKYVASLPKEFQEHFIYKDDYVNMHTEIEIGCKNCTDSFYQKPLNHKSLKICRACNKRIYDEDNS